MKPHITQFFATGQAKWRATLSGLVAYGATPSDACRAVAAQYERVKAQIPGGC